MLIELPRNLSPAGAAILALFAVLIASLLAAVLWISTSFRKDSPGGTFVQAALGAARLAAWIPPLLLLLRVRSGLAMIAAAAVAAIVAGAVFRWSSRTARISERSAAPPLFSLLPVPRWSREVLIAAVTLECSGIALMAGKPLLAVLFATAGAAAVGWRWAAVGGPAMPAALPRASAELAATVLITSLLAFAGLVPFIKRQATQVDAISRLVPPGASGTTEGTPPKPGDLTVDVGDVYAGVIVWPETSTQVSIIPPIPNLARSWPSLDAPVSVSIPFFGAYWFLRAPDTTPPPNSIVIRGNPVERSFRATDHRPMLMEAHQKLGVELDAGCCRGIDVTLRNSDRYPGTVSLELFIVNTRQPRNSHQSLGVVRVETSMPWRRSSAGVSQVLHFEVPPNPAVRRFDQLSMRFHLDRFRNDRSARMAIERFILVPRGA